MRYLFSILAVFLLGGLFSCATQVAPSGGPEDKLPPRVAAVYPAPQSTNIPTELSVYLEFDEWILQSVPRSAVNISPPLEKKLRLDVSGKRLHIYSNAVLDSNTTYTLSVGNALKDLHGNPIAEPFLLSFSTGSKIDSLQLQGRIAISPELYQKKIYPSIALYPIGIERESRHYLKKFRDSTSVGPDTMPQLTKEIPLFIAQADSDGFFKVPGLREGFYRVLAFADMNGNRKLELSDERVGVYGDIHLDSLFKDSLWLALGDLDTATFVLDSAHQIGKMRLQAIFSRPVLLDSLQCVLVDKNSKDTLVPQFVYSDSKTEKPVFYFAQEPFPDTTYTFYCKTALDSLHRHLNPNINVFDMVWQSAPADTLPPKIEKTIPADGEKNVFPTNFVEIFYNQPIVQKQNRVLEYDFNVAADSLKKNLFFAVFKDTIPAAVENIHSVLFKVSSSAEWPLDARVTLLERYADTTLALPDSLGKRDTVVEMKYKKITSFETVSKLRMATLKGTIPGANAGVHVRLRSVETAKIYQVACQASGAFQMDALLEGKYLMDYFYADSLGNPDVGSVFPFRAGAAWRAPQDTLVLEAGENVLESLLLLSNLPPRLK